jgi:hypothetical protein
MKKSFLLYCDLKHTVDKLPDEIAGRLLKLILDYANGEHNDPNDLLLQVLFEPIKQSLIRDLEKYDAKVIRNRENGSKGGRPLLEDNPKKPTGLINNRLEPKKADSDNDSDSDNGRERDTVKLSNGAKKAPSFKHWDESHLIEAMKPLVEKYSKQTCNAFFSYWTEPLPNGKIRLTAQGAWDTNRRLSSWKAKESSSTSFSKPIQPTFSRAANGVHFSGTNPIES